MLILDGHVHIFQEKGDSRKLLADMKQAGIDGGIIISLPPDWFGADTKGLSSEARLDSLMGWASASDSLYPFYWIDPMEPDAIAQVDRAAEAGVAGFKCICTYYNPGDERPMEVWRHIARRGKPLKFHSGILYVGGPSSQYNRPVLFEPLFDIEGLRFCICHISWPWVDECIAVYGKWCSLSAKGLITSELYIDTTPGTPGLYREEALTKLFRVGYDVSRNTTFGTDGTNAYSAEAARRMIAQDRAIFDKLDIPADIRENYFALNTRRFCR